MPSNSLAPLKPSQLRRRFDPKKVPFETSDQAGQCREPVVGQKRAKDALDFGLAMRDMDYHVFVDGPQRTGKTHLVRSFVEKLAADEPPPPDWVYVHNFRNQDQPRALKFPTGQGRAFARSMADLLAGLKRKVPEIFEGEAYSQRKEALTGEFKKKRADVFQELDAMAREEGYVLKADSKGLMVAPAGEDGEPMPESAIREMSDEERAVLREKSDRIQSRVAEALRQVNAWEKELHESLKVLDREMVLEGVAELFGDLVERFAEAPDVLGYLEEVREEVAGNYQRFQKKEQPQAPFPIPQQEDNFKEFQVNVFVDNSKAEGAPVVVESNPTWPNLFGRIERQAQFGALVTDFTLLSPGSLHKANGGYLVLPVLALLQHMLPWEGLKRALRERQVRMEDAAEMMGWMITRSLRPQPIPLDLKVILVGESKLYYLLYTYDPQFPKLFKVRAQMSSIMDWGDDEVGQFIDHLCAMVADRKLPPLHRGAVARLLEHAAEIAGDQEKLSLQLAEAEDVVKESGFLARRDGAEVIRDQDVERALSLRRQRASMLEERMREHVTRGYINIETEGSQVGQINGLAVLDLGDHAFGQAGRITASLGLGKEGVVNIDRESKLSGPFHTKGVLILAGFLKDRFAQDGPLALSAGLVFEQSYSAIDGDSASLAELLAIISRVSGVPLRQDLAVTGSVSQVGQVQAIGGVNHKIEGFYRLCADRGLTGDQGVVIPQANLKNLMLHPDVVEACRKKKFAVYAVSTVEEAVELFTGKPAGRPKKTGGYPRGSVFAAVEKELKRLRDLGNNKKEKKEKKAAEKKPAKPKKTPPRKKLT